MSFQIANIHQAILLLFYSEYLKTNNTSGLIPHTNGKINIIKDNIIKDLFIICMNISHIYKQFKNSKCFETTKVLKERYLMVQDNAIYTFSIELSLSSKGQNKLKLQKQISINLI